MGNSACKYLGKRLKFRTIIKVVDDVVVVFGIPGIGLYCSNTIQRSLLITYVPIIIIYVKVYPVVWYVCETLCVFAVSVSSSSCFLFSLCPVALRRHRPRIAVSLSFVYLYIKILWTLAPARVLWSLSLCGSRRTYEFQLRQTNWAAARNGKFHFS